MHKESLMELVKACKNESATYGRESTATEKINELRDLGFTSIASEMSSKVHTRAKLARASEHCYLAITDEKIEGYLKRKVEVYNETHPKEEVESPQQGGITFTTSPDESYWMIPTLTWSSGSLAIAQTRLATPFTEQTNDYNSTKKGTIGKFAWSETLIEDYKGVPPSGVLQTLKKHKSRNIFDKFTVAEVNSVVDPLLLGRIKGVHGKRFFIAQWGDDIKLDDII